MQCGRELKPSAAAFLSSIVLASQAFAQRQSIGTLVLRCLSPPSPAVKADKVGPVTDSAAVSII